jgi:peptide subunit release factor 1 (eRF1)
MNSFESILKSSITTFVKQEELESQQAMQKLRHSLATDGLAISGYEEVRKALRDYRLDTLIISKECPKTLADAILKEAVVQNIVIETVDDDYLLEQLEGFAGFVRYKLYV